MLTVAGLLADVEVRMLTGGLGLELPVRSVHISELLDPTPWLSGGEVLLTTGMRLEAPAGQREYVERLSDHGLAALGFGTGFGHDEVPPAVLEAAEARGFPVFEVPYDVPFIAITEAAFSRLINEQYAVLQRALGAHERLERALLSERGLTGFAAALAPLLEATVLILDPRGGLSARAGYRREDGGAAAAVAAQVRERPARRFIPDLGEDGPAALAVPVVAGSGEEGASAPEAWLVAVKDAGSVGDFDRLALRQAVPLLALELLRARVAGDTERRLAGDVVSAMAAGDLTGGELARRLAPFGVGDDVAVAVISAGGPGELGELEAEARRALRAAGEPALLAGVDSELVVIVRAREEAEGVAAMRELGERLVAGVPAALRIGLGRGHPAGQARASLLEGRAALETLVDGGAPVRVASHRDTGSFRLLLALQEDDALRVFCEAMLDPIESAERRYGEELVRSLEAFIEENGQWERAARRLPCHRHTLRYRIKRIEELTGRDLGNARDRIDFWLALRGREMLR